MSGMTSERLALIRARTERRWTEQREDRRHHIDPTAADVAVALSDVDVLLEHVDHLTHLLGSHADGHRCTCEMIDPGKPGIEPPTWEQDPWCLTHPDMAVIVAEVERLSALAEGRAERLQQRQSEAAQEAQRKAAQYESEFRKAAKEQMRADKAEADLARVTKERDEQTRDAIEWRNRYEALRADVSERRWDNSVLAGDRAGYATVVLRGILISDDERAGR